MQLYEVIIVTSFYIKCIEKLIDKWDTIIEAIY